MCVPVSNPTGSNIVLRARTQIGVVVPVSSVIPCPYEVNSPVEVNSASVDEQHEESLNETDQEDIEGEKDIADEDWLKKIDLSHLKPGQRKQVKAMLREKWVMRLPRVNLILEKLTTYR